MQRTLSILKNAVTTAAILSAAFGISLLLQHVLQIPEQVTTTFAFAVFLISMVTKGYVYGIVSAFCATIAINYAFTFPYFHLNFTIPTNVYSAIVMIVISLLTSALTTKVKHHETIKAESEKERMRANLLRAISHDLRTPLTTIYGASSALLEDENAYSPQQRRDMLRSIQEDAQWLTRMVENLLSITRIDSGKVKIEKTPIVPEELLDTVIVKFQKRYPRQPLQLRLPEDILLIPMEPILMEQVLLNLLENAVQHAHGMTELTLQVQAQGNRAEFSIQDNGCGIPPDRLEHIFTGSIPPDQQIADGQRRSAGIGLSVCATIVRAHGGEITVQNRPEGGACFRFSLAMEELDHEQQI